jgi:hypothetical protein
MLFRTCYMMFDLYKRTVRTSGRIFQEIKAIQKGLSLEITQCIWDVDSLERDLEVCSS